MAEDEGAVDEMRAALAAQLLQLRPRDLLTQTAVMLANQAAIRIGMASPEHADREQAREAIDALAGVVELLAPTRRARRAGGAAARPRAAAHGVRAVGRARRAAAGCGRAAAGGRRARRGAPSDLDAAAARSDRRIADLPQTSGGRAPAGFLDAVAPEPVADVRGTWRSHKHARIRRV